MAKIRNTEAESFFEKVKIGLKGKKSKGVLLQEKRGQHQMVTSEQMPRLTDRDNDATPLYQKLGFIFKGDDNGEYFKNSVGDDLFIDVLLPDGWNKRASDHAMWSYVDDSLGRERIQIFYKAAFYDRSAFMRLNRRYICGTETELPKGEKREDWYYKSQNHLPQYAFIKDAGVIIWKSEIYHCDVKAAYGDPDNYLNIFDRLAEMAKEQLLKMFPDAADCFAYWEDIKP